MKRLILLSALALTGLCAATTMASAGAATVCVPAVRVPEPSSLALLVGGMGGIYLVRKLLRKE